ncbi:MAG TPA: signal peptidase I [Candidatus Paceibacterota bacterium]
MEPQQSIIQNTHDDQSTIPPKKEHFLKEIIKFTLIALAVVIPIRTYVAQPFIVNGFSMYPTFSSGEYLIVDELTYNFKKPERQDVIVLRYPLSPKTYFIKRIIGLPEETLIVKDGQITIINKENPEGITINDSYVVPSHRKKDNFKITLGPKEYFVMGDNRTESSDSRVWGSLEEKYIVGRPIIRLTPLSKISFFPGK